MNDLEKTLKKHLNIIDHDYKLIEKLKKSTQSKPIKEIIKVYEEATENYDKSLFPKEIYNSYISNFFISFTVLSLFSILAFEFFNSSIQFQDAIKAYTLFVMLSGFAIVYAIVSSVNFAKVFSLKLKINRVRIKDNVRDNFDHNNDSSHFFIRLKEFEKRITDKYNRLNTEENEELDQLLFAYKFKNYHLNSIFKGEGNE